MYFLKKEGPDIWNNMDELEDSMPNEIHQTQKENPAWSHFMWNLKKLNTQKQRVQRWFLGEDGKVGESGMYWSKSKKLKSLRKNNSRSIIYTMKTVVNNSVLSTKNVLRE